jgi:hypothetical protein
MKPKLTSRLQTLGQQAARLRQAIEAAPSKAAEWREAIAVSAAQLQQTRAELQSTVSLLRNDNEERLIQSLRDLEQHRDTLRVAGVELDRVTFELALPPRLLLRLTRVEDVPIQTLRALAQSHPNPATLAGILSALVQAAELDSHIHLKDLEHSQLTIALGPIPTVQVHWDHSAEVAPSETPSSPATPSLSKTPPPLRSGPPTHPPASLAAGFHEQGFFATRSTPSGSPATPSPSPDPSPSATATPNPNPTATAVPAEDWRTHALDRFKKMPTFR